MKMDDGMDPWQCSAEQGPKVIVYLSMRTEKIKINFTSTQDGEANQSHTINT